MSIVIGVDPRTGRQELKHEDGPQHGAQLTLSTYGDMLHDTERNDMYEAAIAAAVRAKGPEAVVLDIGTGTGLLALMAARSGAKHVFACEVYPPMFRVAEQCVAANTMQDTITLIPKRSTDMNVGETGDMPKRADIIVMEIFDSELIGEGVLGTMSHALQHLATPDVIVVPSTATVYAQVIHSPTLDALHNLNCVTIGDRHLHTPKSAAQSSPLECHPDILLQDRVHLTEQTVVNTFDFGNRQSLTWPSEELVTFQRTAEAKIHPSAQFVLFWWTMQLGSNTFATFPEKQWRHHWQPCVYALPVSLNLTQDNPSVMIAHDEYGWRFGPHAPPDPLAPAIPRHRRAMFNDRHYWGRFEAALSCTHRKLRRKLRVLCVGDASLLAVVAAQQPYVDRVYVLEPNFLAKTVARLYPDQDSAKIKVVRKSSEEINLSYLDHAPADVLCAEPHYLFADLPWQTTCLFFERLALSECLREDAIVLPARGQLMMQPARLAHYHTLRRGAGKVSGFDLCAFDAACAPPGWERVFLPNTAYELLASPKCALTVDFGDTGAPHPVEGRVEWRDVAGANCLLAWMDYELTSEQGNEVAITQTNAPETSLWTHTAVHILKTVDEAKAGNKQEAKSEVEKKEEGEKADRTEEGKEEEAMGGWAVRAHVVFDPTTDGQVRVQVTAS